MIEYLLKIFHPILKANLPVKAPKYCFIGLKR